MVNVVSIDSFRKKSRKAYLARHGRRLDLFVASFVDHHVDIDFRQLARDYQANQHHETSWDYIQFREVLMEVLDQAFGQVLYQLLQAQPWFDRRLITKDEVIERCLTTWIMARVQNVAP